MASKPARLLITAAACCLGALAMTGADPAARAQDAGAAPATAATAPAAAPDRPDDRPPFRPGGERLRQQAQQRFQQQQQQQQQQSGAPGWPFDRPNRVAMSTNPPTEAEWRQTAELLAQISPARWQVFEQVTSKPHRADRAKRFLFARYAELRELERANPSLYDARVEQVKVEDEIFRLDSALRDVASPGEADPLRIQLKERVADWVRKDLDERELRLRQLQERLDRERAALEADRGRADEVAERRVETIRRSSDRFRAWAAGGKPAAADEPSPGRPPRPLPAPATSNPDESAEPK